MTGDEEDVFQQPVKRIKEDAEADDADAESDDGEVVRAK